ncbi:MAG: hypothetical protein ACYTG2_08025 [Planctomycetota bacterium]|jgi:hypothetical protein
MKLAILVVYMFERDVVPLVQLHLDRIEENTSVPFTVYGSVTRLDAGGRRLLAQHPFVKMVQPELPRVPVSHREDHDAQLNALRKIAASDGATHFCTMHIDSFPIRPDWVARILEWLDKGHAFACVAPYAFNAGLFWPREWEDCGCGFLAPREPRDRAAFEAFQKQHPDIDCLDGGIGFMFEAWKLGREWKEMRQSSPNIWGGLLLHLVGTTRLTSRQNAPTEIPEGIIRFKNWLRPVLRHLPRPVKDALYRRTRRRFIAWERETRRDGSPAAKKSQVLALTRDPVRFIQESMAGGHSP